MRLIVACAKAGVTDTSHSEKTRVGKSLFSFVVLIGIILIGACENDALTKNNAGMRDDRLAGRPICGSPDDLKAHVPTKWDSFVPPPEGRTYVDPIFGCPVTRITDSGKDEVVWDGKHPAFMNYYSTLTAVNASDTMVMVTATDGSWRVKGTNGSVLVPSSKMPKMNDGHPVWDASNGNRFYFTIGNKLDAGAVVNQDVSTAVLHVFEEYKGVASPDAADLSQDGDHIALVGQNADDTVDVFSWSLSKQAKTSIYRSQCKVNQWGVTETPQPACLHKLQFSPDNNLIIEFAEDGTGSEQGLRLWRNDRLVHLQDHTNHIDSGYDPQGNPIFIELGRSSTLEGETNPCSSGWGLDMRLINNLSDARCIIDRQPPLHVSYRGSKSQPWAAISFFDDRSAGPEFNTDSPHFAPPTADNWHLYEDEIILAQIGGNLVYRLAQARSRSAEGYWNQPHAAISRDGKYVVFTSNMAHPNGCPSNMNVPNECTDVYIIKTF
jgi:hypothetical protein